MGNVKVLVQKIDGTKSELSTNDVLTIPVVSSAPVGNPPTGYVWLYALDSDNHFYQKDDSGAIIDLGASGGINTISGTLNFDFGTEGDFVVNTVSSLLITNANIKNLTIIPIETASTTLDDFSLNGVDFNIENIIDNSSFDIRASSINNASGIYQIKYIINY